MAKAGVYFELEFGRSPKGEIDIRFRPGELLSQDTLHHLEQAGKELSQAFRCLSEKEEPRANKTRIVIPIKEE